MRIYLVVCYYERTLVYGVSSENVEAFTDPVDACISCNELNEKARNDKPKRSYVLEIFDTKIKPVITRK